MSRFVAQIMALICLSLPGWAAEPVPQAPRPLASAFHAMQADRWEVAAQLAVRDGPAAETLVEWYRLRAGRGSAEDIAKFLTQNPEWPGLDYLRRRNEVRMITGDTDTILEFYRDQAPQTGIGALSYATALMAAERAEEAEAVIVAAWRSMDLTSDEHDAFMAAYANILKPHHDARMHMAAWRGLKDVRQMKPLTSKALRKQIETRETIENGRKALSLIRANITKLAAKDDTEILAADATKPGKLKSDTPFDLVFLDPPYGKALGQKALARLHEDGSLAPGALVVWEENGPQDAPEGYTCLETRKFGGTHITFLRAADLETSQI